MRNQSKTGEEDQRDANNFKCPNKGSSRSVHTKSKGHIDRRHMSRKGKVPRHAQRDETNVAGTIEQRKGTDITSSKTENHRAFKSKWQYWKNN